MASCRILTLAACALLAVATGRASEEALASSIPRLPLTIDGRVYLALSGEIRERFEYYSEPFFGFRGVAEDDYLLHRLLLSADLHAGDHWRFFLQLGDYLEAGKQAARSPTDVDEFD